MKLTIQLFVHFNFKMAATTEQELRVAPKRDKPKVRMAARLRCETTMSLKWIAEHLPISSWTNLLGVERRKTAINFTK